MKRIERRCARWVAQWTIRVTGWALLWVMVAFIMGVMLFAGCAQTLPYCEGASCEQGGSAGAGGSQ